MWQFELTKKGKKTLEDAGQLYEASTKPLYFEFSKSEKSHMLTVLERITKHLSGVKEEQIREFIAHLEGR